MNGQPQILVVGAGPTGLTLSCLLWQAGIGCRVVDAAPATTDRSRAIGVSARSLEVLDGLRIADRLIPHGVPSRTALFYSKNHRPVGRLSTTLARDTRFAFLLAVPQFATEQVLETRLVELGGTVERSVRLTELTPGADAASVVLDTPDGVRHEQAAWVVGADGSHSAVRRALGIAFEGDATGKIFANVDALLDNGPTPGTGHYFFTPEGMLVIAPLPDEIYRVTASISPEEADRDLTLADVQEFIDRRGLPGITVRSMRDAGWGIARIRIQARIAAAFRSGRCLLAGDAAHIYGPTGAQGMNAGIQDAHNLAWKLALVATGRADDRLLDTYATERRQISVGVLHHVEQQTRMATVRSAAAVAGRDALLRVATKTGMTDRKMAPTLNQLDVAYPPVPGLTGPAPRRLRRAARAVGRRVPDVALAGAGGDTRLFEVLAGNPLSLLAVCAAPADEARLAALAADLRDRPYADLVALHEIRRGSPTGGPGFADAAGTLHELLGARRKGVLALIRGDQHLAAVAPLADPAGLLRLLDGLLGAPPTGAVAPAGKAAADTADPAAPGGTARTGGSGGAGVPTSATRGDAP
jgi:2-polyprenyl-6-methoxyphenol hydroxylase-like FAD-dependent oxidoreductase